MQRVAVLQHAINESIANLQLSSLSIELDKGSEETDLTKAVGVQVKASGGGQDVLYTIVTLQWLNDILGKKWNKRHCENEIFCTGGPLIVVTSISGHIIVAAVQEYLNRI